MLQPTDVAAPVTSEQAQQIAVLLGQLVQFTSHLSTGAMTAHVIQWLKGVGWFNTIWAALSDRGKIILAALAAALPAAGITATFQHPEVGHYILDIQNLTIATGVALVWSFLQNWLAQQAYYQKVLKPIPVVPVAAGGQGKS